jgi:hypothetical protein
MPYRYHYDPHQPRVPAGHSDGGQWTEGGFGADPRIQQTLLGRGPLPARAPIRAPARPLSPLLLPIGRLRLLLLLLLLPFLTPLLLLPLLRRPLPQRP